MKLWQSCLLNIQAQFTKTFMILPELSRIEELLVTSKNKKYYLFPFPTANPWPKSFSFYLYIKEKHAFKKLQYLWTMCTSYKVDSGCSLVTFAIVQIFVSSILPFLLFFRGREENILFQCNYDKEKHEDLKKLHCSNIFVALLLQL